jgi:hypothetical protein
MKTLIVLTALLLPSLVHAQSYSINWFKVAAGGGSSAGTNGGVVLSLSGTVGQQDGSPAMTGGSYSLTGGFWSLIALVQTRGEPNLSIALEMGVVVVSWPDTGNYTLQQSSNLSVPSGWVVSDYAVTTANGTNSVTIPMPTGSLFFRLANP